jgi:predicted dehydrogenase
MSEHAVRANQHHGDKVRFGVLGCAAIAVHKVIPAMQRSEHCEVVAIGSRDADRAAETATQLGIARSHGSYEGVLDDDAVEAVYIPLPNHLHAEWTMRTAAAGRHVLCEKPLGMDSAEVVKMIEACRDARVLLVEAFMYRQHPMWLRAHELVAEGAIGDLRAIQAVFTYFNTDPANIRNIASFGGGAVMDIGCYPINVARWFFGAEPASVSAAVRRDPQFGTDVLTSALLDFDGGRQASFTCSTQLEPDQHVTLLGTSGRLEVEIPFNIPPDRPTRLVLASGGEPPVAPGLTELEIPTCDPYTAQGDAFARAVREGGPAPAPAEDALGNMRVIDQILAAPAT